MYTGLAKTGHAIFNVSGNIIFFGGVKKILIWKNKTQNLVVLGYKSLTLTLCHCRPTAQ